LIFLGRRRTSTSGFAYMATETAVFAVRSAKPCFSWDTCYLILAEIWNRTPRRRNCSPLSPLTSFQAPVLHFNSSPLLPSRPSPLQVLLPGPFPFSFPASNPLLHFLFSFLTFPTFAPSVSLYILHLIFLFSLSLPIPYPGFPFFPAMSSRSSSFSFFPLVALFSLLFFFSFSGRWY